MSIHKEYIGDSVYATFDGPAMQLTTENGLPDDPSNFIYLEPEVVKSLLNFIFKSSYYMEGYYD